MTYLTKEEILFLNKTWISLYGGTYFEASDNITNINSFCFLLGAPRQEVFGIELYSHVFEKAATYPFYIIKDHIFFDGNKRTGMMTAFFFLEKNGVKVAEKVTSKRIVNYAERIAGCKPSLKNVSAWLQRVSTPKM